LFTAAEPASAPRGAANLDAGDSTKKFAKSLRLRAMDCAVCGGQLIFFDDPQ
jgi:hypothetical protein